jgi:ABC-type lipoprotein release transport system permease subunit
MQDESVRFWIPDADAVIQSIKSIPAVSSWCTRIKATGMASTAHSGNGIMINGINPEQEKQVTALYKTLIEGSYFEKESRIPSIIISQKLSEHLKADLGKKIVLTTAALDGETAQALFRVEGIFKTSNSMYDEMNVFIEAPQLQRMVDPEGNIVSEIAIRTHNDKDIKPVISELQSKYGDLSIVSWRELSASLVAIMAMMDQFGYIMIMIILLALTFGIVNVMLMAILERKRELGMLMAIGMNKSRVFLMIMMETIFMSMTGAVIGIVLASGSIALTNRSGIDFASYAEGFEAYGYSAHVFPVIEGSFYVILGVMVIIAAMLASIWPARKALKLQAAEAVRDDS